LTDPHNLVDKLYTAILKSPMVWNRVQSMQIMYILYMQYPDDLIHCPKLCSTLLYPTVQCMEPSISIV